MTHDTPQNQFPVEQITASTTQSGQERSLETHEDAPANPTIIKADAPLNPTIIKADAPLSNYKSQPPRWLWPDRILLRKLTILEGEPGLGKSLFTLDLAARVTTGQLMPDGSPGIQGSVVLIAPEDAIQEVIKPRVEAAGGDPSRVHLIPSVRICNPIAGIDQISPFILPTHFPILTTTVKKTRPALVIIDPLMAVLKSSKKGLYDPRCRHILTDLLLLAQQTACALILVHHHPGPGNPLLYSSDGPMTYIAGRHTGLLVAQHPADKDVRILATTKNNFSAKACNLIYRIVSNSNGIPTIRWLGSNYTPTASLLKDRTHHLRYSPERQALLKILRTSPVPLSPKELATQTCQDHTLVKQMLRRMFKTGEILSPAYGLYTSHDRPLIEAPISKNTTIIPTTLAATDPDLDQPITSYTPTTLATPTTAATDPDLDQPITTYTPATLTTLATPTTSIALNHPGSNLALPPNTV